MKQIANYNDTLSFGKYEGCFVKSIIYLHPQYIQWCIDKKLLSFADIQSQEELRKSLEKEKSNCRKNKRYCGFDEDELWEIGDIYGLSGGAQGW